MSELYIYEEDEILNTVKITEQNEKTETQTETETQTQTEKQKQTEMNEYGYIEEGNSVYDVKNIDIFDTLSPLWLKRHNLSIVERSLLQSIIVLQHNTDKYKINNNENISVLKSKYEHLNGQFNDVKIKYEELNRRINELVIPNNISFIPNNRPFSPTIPDNRPFIPNNYPFSPAIPDYRPFIPNNFPFSPAIPDNRHFIPNNSTTIPNNCPFNTSKL